MPDLGRNIPIDFHRLRQSMPEGVAAGLRSSRRRLGACALLRIGAIGSDLLFACHRGAPTARRYRPGRRRARG